MSTSSYLVYLSISIIASVSVGPSVIMAATNSLSYGRRKAFKGVLGHVCAILILAIISASGVGALIMASKEVFTVIKIIGACYLAYIGLQIWRSKGNWGFNIISDNTPSGMSLFLRSFTMALSNPKALVFFTALFPQFIDPAAPLLPQFLILTSTSLFNAFAFTFAYALVAYKFKDKLLTAINKGWLPKMTGSLFIGFAALLAAGR